MSGLHFIRPAWFLALMPAVWLLVLLWRRRARADQWRGIVSPSLLPHLLLDAGKPLRRLPLTLLGIGWLLAVTALAGPTWRQQPQAVYRAPSDRVIVLDMSPSMAASDLKPDRLTRARFAVRSLLAALPEGRTALVVFSGEPHVVAPLTDDVATIEALLPALSVDIMPAPGNRAAPALREAGELLERVGSTHSEVLLLSDGIDDPADSLGAVRGLRGDGVRTSVLGVGTLQGAPVPAAGGGFETGQVGRVEVARLDESGLEALARAGGGGYRRLGDGPVRDMLDGGAGHDLAHARAEEHGGVPRWVEEGPWLLLPLLLLAAGGFRRGWLGVLALVVLLPPPAQAFSWQDLWLRPDQKASRLLAQGDAAAAAARFEDPGWKATAQYRAGDYAAAAKSFNAPDSDSAYNRGNALARAGKLREAIAAYGAALKRDAGNEDARFNRNLVEQLLQQQKQEQQQKQGGHSGEGDSQRQNQGGQGESQPQSSSGQSAGQAQSASGGPGQADSQQQQAGSDRHNTTEGQSAQSPAAASPPQARENNGQPPAGAASGAPQADSAERARADVAPATKPDSKGDDGAGDQQTSGASPQNAASGGQPRQPMSEQDLALQQWLHQVPDDPAGLLRRKFMLEHLLRQKGRETP
jgi:Ca-activated chloride channel family protein